MKKILFSILIIIIMLCALTSHVSALSFTPTISSSVQTVAEQTDFVVTIKVSNLDVGQNGINTLTGTLNYDTSVLETINESSIEGLNNWKVEYTESTKEVKAINTSFVNKEEAVFQIVFRPKSGTTGKEANISFSGVSASNSESKISAADISTAIKVGTETQPTSTPISINGLIGTNNTANTNTNTNTNTQNNVTFNSIIQNNVNNTANTTNTANISNIYNTANTVNNTISGNIANTNPSNQDLSYAGVEDGIVKLIFGILIVAALSYWRIHSLKDIK